MGKDGSESDGGLSGGETQENRCKDDPHCSTTCSMAQSAAIYLTQEVNVTKLKWEFPYGFSLSWDWWQGNAFCATVLKVKGKDKPSV